jgi:hypothetical protein
VKLTARSPKTPPVKKVAADIFSFNIIHKRPHKKNSPALYEILFNILSTFLIVS